MARAHAASDFAPVFAALRGVLAAHAHRGVVAEDAPGSYVVNSAKPHPSGKAPMMFAAVRTGKNYVSFHLMPVYCAPTLLAELSPALRRRMQGKACFNFSAPDPALFRELAELTAKSAAAFARAGYL